MVPLHTTLATPNKLLGALVPRAELSAFLDITSTPLKVNAPIGLGIVLINTNDYGR
jgi:hypothetical protein